MLSRRRIGSSRGIGNRDPSRPPQHEVHHRAGSGLARGEAWPAGTGGRGLRSASGAGRRHQSLHGTAKSGRCHRSRHPGGGLLEGSRDGRGMGRESTSTSRSVLKKQTDQSRLGEPSPAPAGPPTDSPARTTRRSDAGWATASSGQPTESARYVPVSNAWCRRSEHTARLLLACLAALAGGGGGNRSGLARAGLIPYRGCGCGPPQPCRSARERRSVPYGVVTGRDILKALPSLRSDCSPSIGTAFTFAEYASSAWQVRPAAPR